MGAWVQKNYGAGKTSSYFRKGTAAGPVLTPEQTRLGVKAIQTELRFNGHVETRVDGVFDDSTDKALKEFQAKVGLVADGVFGPKSSVELFAKRIETDQRANGVPNDYLKGMIAHESGYDPVAIGVNGLDTGLVQINLDPVNGHGGEITMAQALDPGFAIPYAANRMGAAHDAYTDALNPLAWKLAVGQHNSPLNAKRWRDAALSVPPGPTEEDSLTRIESVSNYVRMVDEKA